MKKSDLEARIAVLEAEVVSLRLRLAQRDGDQYWRPVLTPTYPSYPSYPYVTCGTSASGTLYNKSVLSELGA